MNNRVGTASAAAVLAAAAIAQAQSFTQAFDDIVTLSTGGGWFTQNNSNPIGLLNYFQGNTGVFPPQASSGYLAANFNSGAGLAAISNWFATPQLSGLQNGQTFTFYTRTITTPTYPDRLQVRMSLAGASTNVGALGNPTAVGDFTTLLLDINPTYLVAGYPNTWTQFSVTITGVPIPTSGRLAFRYFVENGGPSGSNSDYIGIDSAEYFSGSPANGACCLSNGTCVGGVSAATCTSMGGIYQGDGSSCATPCVLSSTGACCIPNADPCVVTSQSQCTALNGVWMGAGSGCGSCSAAAAILYRNCNLTTGPTTLSGVAAPAGFEWSECARDTADPLTANTVAGFSGSGAFRLADDFVVPSGGINLTYVKVYAYTTGAVAPGVTAATLRILNGSPLGNPNVVFGDQITNHLAKTDFSKFYRVFNTISPPICGGMATAPDTTRRLQDIYIKVNQFLPAGTYWLDFNYTGASFSPASTHADAIGRQCNPQNSNALLFNGTWLPLNDAGQGCTPVPVQQDIYFELLGTAGEGGCYANCDSSTIPPILNVNDFSCFLNLYAASNAYANCDASTIAPVLNVNDFSCFLNKYAAGCP